MFHFTRVLLAAVITLLMAASSIFVIGAGLDLVNGQNPFRPGQLSQYVGQLPEMIAIFGLLLLLVTVPMVILWMQSAWRGWFCRPWIAAITGGTLGLLLSWPWMHTFRLVNDDHCEVTREVTWERYVDAFPILGPYAILSSALYIFLHAFFVRQALAKQEWLATQPPPPERQ